MTRDCGHSTGDDQRLQTQYRRCPETVDTVQEMTRDCGHSQWSTGELGYTLLCTCNITIMEYRG
ncbi:unnamed protein product, partial [Staurois parvus]